MDPASIALIVTLISSILALVRTGAASYLEIKQVLEKYAGQPATPETVEAIRLELLSKAAVAQAVDDPDVRAQLLADGIDPESLRVAK